MESFLSWITTFATSSPWSVPLLLFGLLMLAGLCLPVSEDLVVITGGVLAATVMPQSAVVLFIAIFLGCYLSDWEAYAIGRFGGRALLKWPLGRKWLPVKKIEQIGTFYEKYGFWTLLLGRFIPFGVRNALFISAGIGRMPFLRFCIADGIACIISNTVLFSLALWFGRSYGSLYTYLSRFNTALLILFITVASIAWIWYKRKSKLKRDSAP